MKIIVGAVTKLCFRQRRTVILYLAGATNFFDLQIFKNCMQSEINEQIKSGECLLPFSSLLSSSLVY